MPTVDGKQINVSKVTKSKDLNAAKGYNQQSKETGPSNASHTVPLKKPSRYVTARNLGADQLASGSFDKREQLKGHHQ